MVLNPIYVLVPFFAPFHVTSERLLVTVVQSEEFVTSGSNTKRDWLFKI